MTIVKLEKRIVCESDSANIVRDLHSCSIKTYPAAVILKQIKTLEFVYVHLIDAMQFQHNQLGYPNFKYLKSSTFVSWTIERHEANDDNNLAQPIASFYHKVVDDRARARAKTNTDLVILSVFKPNTNIDIYQ
ncbi:unnamed protein product [Rotaria socialis]